MNYKIEINPNYNCHVISTDFLVTPILSGLIDRCKGVTVLDSTPISKYQIRVYISGACGIERGSEAISRVIDAYILANKEHEMAEDENLRSFCAENGLDKFLENYDRVN